MVVRRCRATNADFTSRASESSGKVPVRENAKRALPKLAGQTREIACQSMIALVVRLVGALSMFGVTLAAARELSQDQAGLFFLGISVITIAATVARLGLDDTVLRFVGAAYGGQRPMAVRSTLLKGQALAVVAALPVALLLRYQNDALAIRIFSKPEFGPVLGAMAPAVVFLSANNLLAQALRGIRRIGASAFVMVVALNAGLILWLVAVGSSYGEPMTSRQAATGYTVSVFVSLCTAALLWGRAWLRGWSSAELSSIAVVEGTGGIAARVRADRPVTWRAMSKSCLPLWSVAIVGQIVMWSSQLGIGAWLPAEDLATFVVAQRTGALVGFAVVAFNYAVAPRFASYFEQGDLVRLERSALATVRYALPVAIPVLLLCLLFPGSILSVFGEDFVSGAQLLRVLVLAQAFSVWTGPVGPLLAMSGHERDLRKAALVGGAVALVGAIVLIPTVGLLGAGLSFAAAMVAQDFTSATWVRRRLGINFLTVWPSIKPTGSTST